MAPKAGVEVFVDVPVPKPDPKAEPEVPPKRPLVADAPKGLEPKAVFVLLFAPKPKRRAVSNYSRHEACKIQNEHDQIVKGSRKNSREFSPVLLRKGEKMLRQGSENAAGRRPKRRDSDAQSFDVPPPPKGEPVLGLLPKRPPPLGFEPKMLPEFVLEPKPDDAGV